METPNTKNVVLLFGTCNYPGLGHGDDFSNPSRFIYVYLLSLDDGVLHPWPTQQLSVFDTVSRNPAFICVSPNKCQIFSVDETDQYSGSGAVISISVDPSAGRLLQVQSVVDSKGKFPCYCSLDQDGNWLFVANYGEGTIASFPILKEGTLGPAVDTKHHHGTPLPAFADRQQSSHPHMIQQHPYYTDYVFVTDLGLDTLWVYHFDKNTGALERDLCHLEFQRGVGPRHFSFHPTQPDTMYVMHEMSGTASVVHLEIVQNKLKTIKEVQQVQTLLTKGLQCSRASHEGGSDIQVSSDGLFLYCINRTDQTITFFGIEKGGTLSKKGSVPTLGKIPRSLRIVEGLINDWLVVVNQESKLVVVFRRDKVDGGLSDPKSTPLDVWPTCVGILGGRNLRPHL